MTIDSNIGSDDVRARSRPVALLQKFLHIVWDSRMLVVEVTAIAAAMAIVISLIMPNTFKAVTILTPDTGENKMMGLAGLAEFASAAGLSGAVQHNSIVITAGIAEIVAGSIAMGLGGYLAGKTEQEHYQSELKREYDEVEDIPEEEKKEVRLVFAKYGLNEKTQNTIADELAMNKDNWVDFMMKYCLDGD